MHPERLSLALESHIPLISATSRDTLNFPAVVKELTGMDVMKTSVTDKKMFAEFMKDETVGKLWFATPASNVDLSPSLRTRLYKRMLETKGSLILLNHDGGDEFYKAGEVPVPEKLLDVHIRSQVGEETADEILPHLSGLTMKEVGEVLALTHIASKGGGLSAEAVMMTRRNCYNTARGLYQVNPYMDFYIPNAELSAWADKEYQFFMELGDLRLQPRGMLFSGPSGTGKTQGAKFLALAWNLPLYRLDVSSLREKYVGESEKRLEAALTQIERESPAIMLVDEVEKGFNDTAHDSGVQLQMLSQLLWWMEEHRSKVLTIMTTNDTDAIPVELIRPGRIDKEMHFPRMADEKDAVSFLTAAVNRFDMQADPSIIVDAVKTEMASANGSVSHAKLEKLARDIVKTMY